MTIVNCATIILVLICYLWSHCVVCSHRKLSLIIISAVYIIPRNRVWRCISGIAIRGFVQLFALLLTMSAVMNETGDLFTNMEVIIVSFFLVGMTCNNHQLLSDYIDMSRNAILSDLTRFKKFEGSLTDIGDISRRAKYYYPKSKSIFVVYYS